MPKLIKVAERKETIDWEPAKVWKIYPDPKAEAIFPRWWHKLFFWKKWNYQEWKVRREFKELNEIANGIVGKQPKLKNDRLYLRNQTSRIEN